MMYSMMCSQGRTSKGNPMRLAALLLGLLLSLPGPLAARGLASESPPLAVPDLVEAHLSPDHWITALADPGRVVLSREQIARQNARMTAEDPSIHDLEALPARLDRARVHAWIEKLSSPPGRDLYDAQGQPVTAATLAQIQANLALEAVPASQATRYGMVV